MQRASLLRFAVVLLIGAGCARLGWQGTQSLSRDVSVPVDSVLATAARALQERGYAAQVVNGESVVTLPRAVPQYTTPVSTAAASAAPQWVLHVTASPNRTRAGSKVTVAGYVIDEAAKGDSLQVRRGVPVTAGQPELFRELERVGNWIVEALARQP